MYGIFHCKRLEESISTMTQRPILGYLAPEIPALSATFVYNEILLLAMKREEKALQLYNDLLDKADSADSRTLFKVLCQEEAKHKLALETTYDDYMAQMGD